MKKINEFGGTQSAKQRTMSKLSVMVDFPVHGLDVTSHLASRSQNCSTSNPEIQSEYTSTFNAFLFFAVFVLCDKQRSKSIFK